MKHFIVGGLSILALSAGLAPVAHAATIRATPEQVLNLAYNGSLENQGIPRFGALQENYQNGSIAILNEL